MTDKPTLRPLFVDLDGTLIASDMLWLAIADLVRREPIMIILLPLWLIRGKAFMKYQIARRITLDTARLPYRNDVLDYLRQQKSLGRTIILATASDRTAVQPVADHLDLFDSVIASDGKTNIRAHQKLEAITQYMLDKKLDTGFDYIGDSVADLPVFVAAENCLLVNPTPALFDEAARFSHVERIFGRAVGWVWPLIKATRPTQWVKNFLLAVPLFVGHELSNLHKWIALIIAFITFSLCASAVYLINDLLDIAADRQHTRKQHRPIAAGFVPIEKALLAAAGLLLASFLIAGLTLGPLYFGILVLYFFLTTSYSLHFKRKPVIDVLFLAGLYTLRIIAGGIATDIEPSQWLLAFSMFFFLSLAFAKRYAELAMLLDRADTDHNTPARGYVVGDIDLIAAVGLTSGYMAVLVMGLYISSPAVTQHYTHPSILWLTCPLFLYWLTKLWLYARRRKLNDDPLIFALKDRSSYIVGLFTLLLVMLATG